MINRRKRKFALRLKLKAGTKAGKKRARIELDCRRNAGNCIFECKKEEEMVAEARDRRFSTSLQNRRGRKKGKRFCILPLSPSHYATFSLRVTESTRSGQESTKCGICYACKFNDVNIWLTMVGDKRNNTEVFRANDGLENECLY